MSSLIECKGVSKRYYRQKKREVHALRHVNLTIEKGDIFGIIGLSGAGKSTLLRCLATLEKPSFGQILVAGLEIATLEEKALRAFRQQIGLIFQHFHLFSSRTVKENVAYPMEICRIPKQERRKRTAELLALVDLKELGDAYPSQLSGGQKQRVGIARALANQPRILLCDEATSSLDPKTTQEILALLQELQQKLDLTIVLITHEMEVIKQICNKVAVLEQGEVVEKGLLSEVFVEPKHPVTKSLVRKTIHEIPPHFHPEKGKLLHLHFKGKGAEEPIITQMIKRFDVEANILLGWIDSLQTVTVGNLIIQLSGNPPNVEEAMEFLRSRKVLVEVIENA